MPLQERAYQSRLMNNAINDWFGRNKHNVRIKQQLIESPCGSGKTIIALQLAKAYKNYANQLLRCDSGEVGIAWIAGRHNLLTQTDRENKAFVGCEDVHYISQFITSLDDHPITKYKHIMMISDEAHHSSCYTVQSLVNALDPCHIIGLTATPKRGDNVKLAFQKTYRDAGYRTLIDEGWLAQFDHWTIPDWKPETVVHHYLARRQEWGKTIMYFRTAEECERAIMLLRWHGVPTEFVTGVSDRDTQIDAFEDGKVDVLVNMFVLTEGFDCSSLKTAFVRDSYQTPTVQMCGRALRPHPDIPVANIIQSSHSIWPFVKTASAHRQMVCKDGVWTYVGANDVADRVVAENIRELVAAPVDENAEKALRYIRHKNAKKTRHARTPIVF